MATAKHSDIASRRRDLVPDHVNAIVVCFLNEDSARHARILVRRFKRTHSATRVGAVFWSESDDIRQIPALEEADFVATTLTGAAREALSDVAPTSVLSSEKRKSGPADPGNERSPRP